MTNIQPLGETLFVKPDQGLRPPADISCMIRTGRVLLLAGAEEDLASLPAGNWIGGTAAHFATPQGCVPAAGQIFFTDFTALATAAHWRRFGTGDIHTIAQNYPANGFAILLMPGFSALLAHTAQRIMEFDGLYNVPLMGWVSSVSLANGRNMPAEPRPAVFAGGPQPEYEQAAVLYITLPDQYFAQLNIANLFTPGSGPDIKFLQSGQIHEGDCLIGGKRRNLARYIEEQAIDPRLPLVADHDGALLNAAILHADAQNGRSVFLAPVAPALTYRFAEEVLDYQAEFTRAAEEIELHHAAHACICVLHYHYTGLQHAKQPPDLPVRTLAITAPITFGQIAYTVLNQTLACLAIGKHDDTLEEGLITAPIAYKVLTTAQLAALQAGTFTGAPVDMADGYIHLSTAAQLTETVQKHFAGQTGLIIAAVDLPRLGPALRWEPSRGGQLFPHFYGTLRMDHILAHAPLTWENGQVALPAP